MALFEMTQTDQPFLPQPVFDQLLPRQQQVPTAH